MKRLRLFLSIVWRPWESIGGVPEPYRVTHRLTVAEAWQIVRTM